MNSTSTQRPVKWAAIHFNDNEWTLVKDTWRQLIEDEAIVLGIKPPTKVNMDRLIEELKRRNRDFKKDHRTGFPAGSKKYRRLYQFVER